MAKKGFIKDWNGQKILPITRAELVLDKYGNPALTSSLFAAGATADGTVNEYGLISAAERALLSGGAGVGSLSDLSAKLEYVNQGLQVNGTTLNFYNSQGTHTPINIVSSDRLVVNKNGQNISVDLQLVNTEETSISAILKSIEIDKYGRVISVSGSPLSNEELPKEISGKSLIGCTTIVGENEDAIVNKKYVDSKFNIVSTGALRYGSVLDSVDAATNVLNANNVNTYFKVSQAMSLPWTYFSDGTYTGNRSIKVGDTLIVINKSGSYCFEYIPSGDEDVTTITVSKENELEPSFKNKLGQVELQFSEIFSIQNPNSGNRVEITLPKATSTSGGYLSSQDWNRFNSYADSAVSYTPKYESATGSYDIGTLVIGTAEHIIKGINNISTFSLESGTGTNTTINPILKFTETGSADVKITLKGGNGVIVSKNGSDVEFRSNISINSDSTSYLESNGHQIGVKFGSVVGNSVNDGLISYKEVYELTQGIVANTIGFESIDYSLSGDPSKDYQYGSKLEEHIDVLI